MKRALLASVVPALRSRGFTGSFPHYRRRTPAKIDLLTFQFDRHGGGFVIEIAEAPAGDFTTPWGQQIPASRLSAHDLHPGKRVRLQPGADGSVDSWYRYDRDRSASKVARQVETHLPEADAWWHGSRSQPHLQGFDGGAV
jgi:uncharacterized protein DUF4304